MSEPPALQQVVDRSTWIPRPIEHVFPFFADAANLERITPPELNFRIVSPLPIEMRLGALIEYRLTLFSVPFHWRTEISHWEPPHQFVDRQLAGPYRQWIHTHEFVADSDGTRMRDRVEYVLPLAQLGLVVLPLVRRQLERIFDFREITIQRLLGHQERRVAG
jgi:ligand-binding SRPBCC domain-containing protein